MESLTRKLEKTDNNEEELNKILKEFGNEMGRLTLTEGGVTAAREEEDEV